MEMEAQEVCGIDYEYEYRELLEEYNELKEENRVLLEALMKVAAKVV